MNRIDFSYKYIDVHAWLKILAYKSYKEYLLITDKAIAKTAEYFKIPFGRVEKLTVLEKVHFNKEQETLLIYYFEYIRKNQAFQEWCRLL